MGRGGFTIESERLLQDRVAAYLYGLESWLRRGAYEHRLVFDVTGCVSLSELAPCGQLRVGLMHCQQLE